VISISTRYLEIHARALRNADISITIATGYGLEDLVSISSSARFLSSSQRQIQLQGPVSVLTNGYRGLFRRG
jgi:hypothetical protein